jgi:hypothetical protein
MHGAVRKVDAWISHPAFSRYDSLVVIGPALLAS